MCVAIDEAHCVLQWLVQLYCCCFLSLNVHVELLKERTMSVLKLMESTWKLFFDQPKFLFLVSVRAFIFPEITFNVVLFDWFVFIRPPSSSSDVSV